jgi:hypothetical protein
MANHKIITVSRRVRLHNIHKVKDDIFDLTYSMRRRVNSPDSAKPKESVVSAAPRISISENGFFVYRNCANKEWGCLLSKQEETLIRAILTAKDACLDGNEAFKIMGLDSWRDTKRMKAIIGGINRKLTKVKVPVKVSSANWQYRFMED